MKKQLLIVFGVLVALLFNTTIYAQTQTNLALTAVSTHSGGGAGVYGPANYNDGIISNCGSTPWGWVSTNGSIQYEWSSPVLVGKVIFYKDNRPMTQCVIEYWDGSSFQTIMNYNNTATCLDSVSFPTVTTTRLRFRSVAGSGNPNHREIEVYSGIIPCTGVPTTYIEGPGQACKNRPFTLTLNGLKITSNLTFQWQYSNNGTTWSNYTGAVAPLGGAISDSISATKWYRCLVTCTNSGQSYQTPPYKVVVANFYYCYCLTKVSDNTGFDIGNMNIISDQSGDTLYNVGSALPFINNKAAVRAYTDYTSVPSKCLYRDSTYTLSILQNTSTASFKGGHLTVYIDINRNGVYDTATERVISKVINGTSTPAEWTSASFTVPSNAAIGLTGMRVILSDNPATYPCEDISGQGEVEDYIVEMCYRPCDGPTNAGIAISSDTSMCVSYEYVLTDTTYERARSGFRKAWQISADKVSWFDVGNSVGKDTLNRIFTGQPLYYRMQVVCPFTDDTTYSQDVLVNSKPGYKCYCYSKATGGNAEDTSDIGGITIGGYSQADPGSHLKNEFAFRPRTDHTDKTPIEFFTDSVYSFYVFHTLNGIEHGDSKITVFVDFNNNNTYDIPEERIYTGFTSVGSFTLVDKMVIPYNVISDVPTGMRFILNNDVGPNTPSDEACGPYTSGETEDFIVIFRRRFAAGVGTVAELDGFGLYPNPTTGKFHVQFNTKNNIEDVNIVVTNVTGQRVLTETYQHSGNSFDKELDIQGQPKGVYFVELQVNGKKIVRKLMLD